MPTNTTTYSFQKPVVGADEDAWGGYLNGNWDKVDDLFDGTVPVTGIDINSGTLDGVTIGGTTAGAGTFTTLTATTSITGTLATAAQPNVTSLGTLTSLTVSGDVSFGDNDKAIFGAGSDLQIYHDGSNSYISDQGTGNLRILADNLYINNAANTQNYISGVSGGALNLFHNGSPKLATTSTGIDVTGTVTADGLTVDTTNNSILRLRSNDTAQASLDEIGTIRFESDDGSITETVRNEIVAVIKGTSANTELYFKSSEGNDLRNRMMIDFNGDISFYEDTGTTAKFFWDASAESLGIGTSSPSAILHTRSTTPVLTADGSAFSSSSNGTGFGIYRSAAGRTAGYTWKIENAIRSGGASASDYQTDDLLFKARAGITDTTLTEHMRITSTGNVGIGTDAPTNALTAMAGSSNTAVATFGGTNTSRGLVISTNTGGGLNEAGVDFNAQTATYGQLRFSIAGSEAMRIDSSGNVLVGTTDTTLYNNSDGSEGVRIAEDHVSIASNARTVFYVNRQTSDGEIINIRKDGTTVGSIGVASSAIHLGNQDTGIRFAGGADAIQPWNTGTNAARDDAIDLGTSSARFKDLYLGGGVYLGGTGAANKLNSYEEGTWTPTLPNGGGFSFNATSARYIKVGNKVTVSAYLAYINPTANTSQFQIGGLPFAAKNTTNYYSSGSLGYAGQNNLSDVLVITGVGLSYIYFHESDGPGSSITNNGMRSKGLDGDAADAMIFTLTYFT